MKMQKTKNSQGIFKNKLDNLHFHISRLPKWLHKLIQYWCTDK